MPPLHPFHRPHPLKPPQAPRRNYPVTRRRPKRFRLSPLLHLPALLTFLKRVRSDFFSAPLLSSRVRLQLRCSSSQLVAPNRCTHVLPVFAASCRFHSFFVYFRLFSSIQLFLLAQRQKREEVGLQIPLNKQICCGHRQDQDALAWRRQPCNRLPLPALTSF